MSTRTIPASEIARLHLGRPVAADFPTNEGTEHAEGTLRWFAHHEADLVALGIESPRTGITDEWQLSAEDTVTVQVVPAGSGATHSMRRTVPLFPEDSYVVLGWSEVDQPRIWMGRQFGTRLEAAVFAGETADRSADWSGRPWAFAVATVSVVEDDPHDAPDEDTECVEGGAA